jgi:pimeloyl-ACP methyl ester carboxylesterase
MPTSKINDITLYYESHGQGEPVVLIAGFGSDHTVWGGIVNLLKDSHQVIVLDNRGIGQTDVPTGIYSIKQMAQDVIALCDHLGVKKAHFVGNSMGGFIVQSLAYHYPDRTKSILISNSTTNAQCCFNIYLAAQLELLKAEAPLISLIKSSCSWVFSYGFLSQPEVFANLVQLTLDNPYPFTITGYEGQYAAIKAFDSRQWINQINVSTLVMGADEDLIFNEKSVKSLADSILGSTYFSFSHCGHLPFIEYPEKFARLVVEHVQKNKC